MAQLTFDSSQYNPEQGVGQLSVGRHLVVIEKDEIKKANGSNGGYLQFDLKGVNQSQGETGAYRLNLFAAGENAQKTIEIASRQLSAVCHAVGVPGLNGDTSVLWNLPFMVEVAYQKGHNPKTDGEDAKGYTEIKRVYYADGSEIKPGQYGAAQANAQQGGFGNQGQQNQNQNNGGNFGNNNQNQNQQQDNTQQQNSNGGNTNFGNNNGGNTNFGNNNGNTNQNQNQNNGGGWTPGQGNNNAGAGQQWTPRT